jgi:PAS domain S-box-containing protein
LEHWQDQFTIEFASLSYIAPQSNRYRYKLEGFEKSWNEVGADRRTATYTNLAPDKYVFRVQGSNEDLLWSETGVSMDITDRKLNEDAKQRTDERNRAILRAIPDLMFLQTLDGVYLDYHAKDPKSMGLPSNGFLGKNMRDVLPAHLAEGFLKRFKRAETGEPQIMEYDLEVNGSHGWFEARIVRTGDNVLSVVRDVSARKLSEIALTQNEAQLARIIGSAMDAIITVDKNHKVVVFNAAAERLFLCSAADALGQPLERFLPERFRNEHDLNTRLFGEEANPDTMGLRGDLYGLRASGEEFPIEASISYIDLNGQQFFTVIIRDITERKLAVDELRNSEERFGKAFRSNPRLCR